MHFWKLYLCFYSYSYPQFKFDLSDADQDEDYCTIIVSLTGTKTTWKQIGVGFRIYCLPTTKQDFDQILEAPIKPVVDSGPATAFPVATKRFELESNKSYVIIPFTVTQFENEEVEFLLRIFSEKPTNLQKLVQKREKICLLMIIETGNEITA